MQRRHQKVLEEAPAPGMSEARRREMGAAAVAAAKAVGYVGAGTVEFIAEPSPDGDLRFFFMEMNTRLQVEHPVTEAITGLDLVEWQLRVACGEPLAAEAGRAAHPRPCHRGAHLRREPRRQFPARHRHARGLSHAAVATHFARSEVRIDAGVREGDAISPFYDSMVAKLIVWGADRAQALARLDAALARTHIVGLHTNVAFLRRVVTSRSFAHADLDTALIERERAALFEAPPLPLELVAAGVVAQSLALEATQQDADPWSKRDAWRLHGAALRRFDLLIGAQHHVFTLERSHGGTQTLVLGEQRWAFGAQARGGERHDVTLGERRWSLSGLRHRRAGDRVRARGQCHAAPASIPIAHAGEGAGEGGRLTAPMPGKVIAFLATAGEAVKKGQPLAVMEAMKMEHTLTAPHDGTVEQLLYAVGDQVMEGEELLRLAAAA